MPHRHAIRVSTLLTICCCGILVWGSENESGPETIAGRTLGDYQSDLASEDRVVRLRAIKSAGAFGSPAGEMLGDALEHSDAAVRYVAAIHLGGIGGETLQGAKEPLQKLSDSDDSKAVRMAAAYALCELGLLEEHLPTLIAMLEHPNRGTACSAAELIGALGSDAGAAIDALEKTYQANRPGDGGDYHLGGAVQNALRKVRDDAK